MVKQQHERCCGSDTCAEAEGHGRSASHPENAGSGTRDKRPDADGNIIDPKRGAAHAIGRSVGNGSSERPCVTPSCKPQSAAPSAVSQTVLALANTTSALIRTAVPIPSWR